MLKTFGQEFEELKDLDDYPKIISKVGILTEKLLKHIFNNFHTTLKTKEEQQRFLDFKEKQKGKLVRGNYRKFLAKLMLGQGIAFYVQLANEFKDNPWIDKSILKEIDLIKNMRNDFGLAHDNPNREADISDAEKVIFAFEKVLSKLNFKDVYLESNNLILKQYLVYDSIKLKFEELEKDGNWNQKSGRVIIEDSKKILPELLNLIITKEYPKLKIKEQKEVLEFLDDKFEIFFDNSINLAIEKYIELLVKMNYSQELIDNLEKINQISEEKLNRFNLFSYVGTIELIFEELLNQKTKRVFRYAARVKDFCLSDSEIEESKEIRLKEAQKQLELKKKDAKNIQEKTIKIIRGELTPYRVILTNKNFEIKNREIFTEVETTAKKEKVEKQEKKAKKDRKKKYRLIFGISTLIILLIGVGYWFSLDEEIIKGDIVGSGTEEDPFIIYTFAGLEKIGQTEAEYFTAEYYESEEGYPLYAHYKLGADIDASPTRDEDYNNGQGWKPIGYTENVTGRFTGSFDGQGYEIKNLYLNWEDATSEFQSAFFPNNEGVIKNLGLLDIEIESNIYQHQGSTAGLVSWNSGQISNSYVIGTINGGNSTGGVGGLVALNQRSGIIKDSYVEADITHNKSRASIGGLVNRNRGEIKSSYFDGNVNGNDGLTAGLVANNEHGAIIDSYATGSVIAEEGLVGGLVAYNNSRKAIKDSRFAGEIQGEDDRTTGGLIGYNDFGEIINSGVMEIEESITDY